MDGTLINSLVSAEIVWGAWAVAHGLDPVKFLPTIHGARSVDTITKLNLPGVDPVVEARKITEAEIEIVEGIVEIPGAIHLLKSLPAKKWAIVTSAPRALAMARIKAAGLPVPEVLVAAEDVTQGKPNPDCYRLAAKKLNVDITDCLVFEDAPIGIKAGENSGAEVMVITATHAHPMVIVHPSIPHYLSLKWQQESDGFLCLKG